MTATSEAADPFGVIARAIAQQVSIDSQKRAAEQRAADEARPIGAKALDFDFWSKADRDKPVEGGSYTRRYRDAKGREHEQTVTWYPAQWCICLYRWDGKRWKKLRRITGPIGGIGAALDALIYEVEITGIPRMPS